MEDNNDLHSGNNLPPEDKRPLGLDENLVGLLCYLGGPITGVLFLILEKENLFVKFHAVQSIIVFIALYVVSLVIGYIPFIGWALAPLVSLLGLIVWIVLMVKAYKHEWYRFPVIGNISKEIADKYKG